MKIDGQLERAQFENIASTSPTPSPLGRVYTDTTNAAAAVPMFHNGTAWRPFALDQSQALVSQNGGKACTVNWANGLYQQVILNDHCVISFSNPQAGKTHVLVVTQRATEAANTTPYMYRFNMADQHTRRGPYQPKSVLQSSESQVHAWFYNSSMKAAYATVPTILAAPATLPSTLMTGIDIHPKLNIVSGGRTSSPFSQGVLFWDAGAKFVWQKTDQTAPTAAAAQVAGYAYHPDGHTAFVASGTSPFIQAFGVDVYGVPNANTYANPGTLPAGAAQCIAVHPSGSHVAVGHTTTPFISCYPINSGAFGTKLADPASVPAAQVNAVAWNPTGDFIAVASQTSPYLEIYPFDPFTGFGAKLNNPAVLPAGGPAAAKGKGVAWHPSGNYVAIGMTFSPYVSVYAFNRSTGTIGAKTDCAVPGTIGTSVNVIQFSPCGNYLVVGGASGLFFYDFTTWGVSDKISVDGGTTATVVNDLVFHPSGEIVFAALNSSPFISAWAMPRKAKNYAVIQY
jgi:WD40 repeat protein